MSQALSQLAQAAFVAGEPTALRAAGEEGRDLADAIGDRFGSRQCRWRLAGVPLLEGDLPETIAQYREVIAESEADHDTVSLTAALMILSHVLAFHGEPAAARAAAEAGIESAADLGGVYLGGTHISLMVSHLAAGDVAAASDAAETGWSQLKSLYGTASINSAYIAQTYLARGDIADAQRSADEGVAATVGWFQAWSKTIRARVSVEQGELEQAERDAHDALAHCADIKAYLGISNALEILAGLASNTVSHRKQPGCSAQQTGIRQRTGEVRLPMYQAGYDDFGAGTSKRDGRQRVRSGLGRGRRAVDRPRRSPTRSADGVNARRPSSGWASLTPAELDVVRLVSEGLGNKDIAARLFVSPRTVQSHLTRVYTKLGLSSRVQLAQEAARRSTRDK